MTSTYMITPYTQYNTCKQLIDWADAINKYIQQYLTDFFAELKSQLDIRNSDTDNKYTFFYLQHYYGISKIPNPSSSRAQTKNNYDQGNLMYDDSAILFDDVIEDESVMALLMNPRLFSAIARFILNYGYRVFSIPAISSLLKEVYFAFEATDLDLRTIKFTASTDNLLVELPDREVWRQLKQISKYNPELLGLPFGEYVQFDILGDSD